MNILKILINIFNKKEEKKQKEEIDKLKNPIDLISNEYEKKLALIIKDINKVDRDDLKNIEYKIIDPYENNDLFTSYRLDFHLRDDLEIFKKKYNFLIL